MVLTTSQVIASASTEASAPVQQLTVKLAASDRHFRRFQIPQALTLEQFKAKYVQQAQQESAEPRQVNLVFLDDEKDWCSITTEEEWTEAKKIFAQQGILKLKVAEESSETGCPWARGCRRWRGGAGGEFRGRRGCRGFFLKKLLCFGALAVVFCKFLGCACILPIALVAFFGFKMIKRAHCRRMQGLQGRQAQCKWSECFKKVCDTIQAHCSPQQQPQAAQQPEVVPSASAPAPAPAPEAAQHQERENRLYPEAAPSAPAEKTTAEPAPVSAGKHQYHDSLYSLEQMGFGNNLLNMHLLKHHKGDLTAVIGDLIRIQGIEKTYSQ